MRAKTRGSVEGRNVKFVIAASPDFACWACEEPLPPGFCGVSAQLHPHPPMIFLTCSLECQATVLSESEGHEVEVYALKPPEVRALLDRENDMVSIVEGQRMAGGLLLAPYGEGLRGIVRERLAMALKAKDN